MTPPGTRVQGGSGRSPGQGAVRAQGMARSWRGGLCVGCVALLLWGCATPIGVRKVTTRQAYAEVETTALRTGRPGAETQAVLHRWDLERLAARHPDQAVRELHRHAVATGDHEVLFSLAELSYVAAERIRHSAKRRETRDARDFYLGSAVYAWLYLFQDGGDPGARAFDRRFRLACDYYNYCLALALTEPRGTNGVVRLEGGVRRLPVGQINLRSGREGAIEGAQEFETLLIADQFRVRGLTVRNRQGGVGAPVVAVRPIDPELGVRRAAPATVLLRVDGALGSLEGGAGVGTLEFHSAFERSTVRVGAREIPLHIDLTTHTAYVLNQSHTWDLGMLHFLAPAEAPPNRLVPLDAFRGDRIPVVYVHGTFSSPVTWAELNNTLTADPVLRRRYQTWSFLYTSGNPLVVSAADLRDALTAAVHQLDPEGTNASLRQMVVIGHSQGGLLTKLTATGTGEALWQVLAPGNGGDSERDVETAAELRRLLVMEPLPFVRRVVFISTPHRGSYRAGGLVRRLGRRLVALPASVISAGSQALLLSGESSVADFLEGHLPTSLDGMSPNNPALRALAEIPVAPHVAAHSIIPVRGHGDFREGRDGIVSYESAHVDGVESELVVRGGHSCQNLPVTIEEVRRILHRHLESLDAGADAMGKEAGRVSGGPREVSR